jgi:hypothetical protein
MSIRNELSPVVASNEEENRMTPSDTPVVESSSPVISIDPSMRTDVISAEASSDDRRDSASPSPSLGDVVVVVGGSGTVVLGTLEVDVASEASVDDVVDCSAA